MSNDLRTKAKLKGLFGKKSGSPKKNAEDRTKRSNHTRSRSYGAEKTSIEFDDNTPELPKKPTMPPRKKPLPPPFVSGKNFSSMSALPLDVIPDPNSEDIIQPELPPVPKKKAPVAPKPTPKPQAPAKPPTKPFAPPQTMPRKPKPKSRIEARGIQSDTTKDTTGKSEESGGSLAPPLLPPKPGTQKVERKNYKSAAPSVCPPDIYEALEDLISKEDPRNRYINLVEIGQGSSGTVAVGTDIQTGEQVAIKKMILAKGINQIFVMKAEILFMRMAKHKNIVGYIESYIVGNVLWCVMEYMDAGDITELVRCTRKIMNERHCAIILREVLEGLVYLHTLPYPIMHRDMKSDNVLLGKDGRIKITDFGFAAQLTPEKRSRNEVIGTGCWMAPEVIMGNEYATKTDVWSLGILAMELVDGDPPYFKEPVRQAMFNIAKKGRGNFKNPEKLSPEFKNFVKQCTIMDFRTRPRSKDLLRHPFLLKYQDGDVEEITPLVTAMIASNTIKYEIF